MTILDRLLIRSFLKAYLVCLVSVLGLYIVVDMFTNLDDFTQSRGLTGVLKHIAVYYGYKVTKYFDQLCEVIALLAAMFTVAWVQRHNELLPLLSAGVSTRRVVRPVLAATCGMLVLGVLNQEVLIPHFGTILTYDRGDPDGSHDLIAHGGHEPNGIYIHGQLASRQEQVVWPFHLLIPESIAGNMTRVTAAKAYYVPRGQGPHSEGWLLVETKPTELPDLDTWSPRVLKRIDPGKFFLPTTEVTFDSLTRPRTWYTLASTYRISQELNKSDSTRLAAMAVLFHMRLTRPILGMILVFLGLSVILRDQNRNIFISTGLCLALCALFFMALFACKSLGENDYLTPALAAWLPVLFFGPLAFALFDAVHT